MSEMERYKGKQCEGCQWQFKPMIPEPNGHCYMFREYMSSCKKNMEPTND